MLFIFPVNALILSSSAGILSYFIRRKEETVSRMFIVVVCETPTLSFIALTIRESRRVFAFLK